MRVRTGSLSVPMSAKLRPVKTRPSGWARVVTAKNAQSAARMIVFVRPAAMRAMPTVIATIQSAKSGG